MISVIVAAAAAWVFGAVWYGIMGKTWMEAAELSEAQIEKNRKNISAFVGSFIMALLVAGMMRHVFASSGIDTLNKGLMTGLGLGLFIATPWITTNYLFAQRRPMLIVIDGIYATGGCVIMGIVLTLL